MEDHLGPADHPNLVGSLPPVNHLDPLPQKLTEAVTPPVEMYPLTEADRLVVETGRREELTQQADRAQMAKFQPKLRLHFGEHVITSKVTFAHRLPVTQLMRKYPRLACRLRQSARS